MGLLEAHRGAATFAVYAGAKAATTNSSRALAVELAWLWVRYQPQSALSRWYQARYARGGPRLRRIGIVALARKLVIALWRYVAFDQVPEGALVRAGG